MTYVCPINSNEAIAINLNVMAESAKNVVTYGLKGKVGDLLVFRQRDGKTIVGKVPAKSSTPPSEAQVQVKERFKLASMYAKEILLDPEAKMRYETLRKRGQTSYNVAFADFFLPPVIENLRGVYTGLAGASLMAKVTDNYEVVSVLVTVLAADGSLLEQGNAVKQANGFDWQYICTAANASTTGCSITWQATDYPGNTSIQEIVI